MIRLKYLPFFFLMVLLFSCKSVPDDFIMFRDLNKGKNLAGTNVNMENSRTTIQVESVLQIIVSSGNVMDTKISHQFNLIPLMPADPTAPATTRVSNDMAFQTYTVDEKGEIEFPQIGKIKVQGLSHFELEAILQKKLEEHVSDPVVRVTITQNFVKVFGEVMTPGLYAIENRNNYTILDALAQAGGILASGDKKEVKLIRTNNGGVESAVLDLTNTDVFTSPYYHVKQNDVIIVDPNNTRREDAQYGSADNYRLSVIGSVISSISFITSMVLLFINKK